MNYWKKHIPPSLKVLVRQTIRKGRDIFNGNDQKFASAFSYQNDYYTIIEIAQDVKTSPTTLNKLHNLNLAIKQINCITIHPGKVFSFWKLVGTPSQKNGYQKSRSIINGEMESAVGGGLCQLSGLIYFLALKAGLTIIERHAHSMDIYTEEERFTPLGSDATVVYGYKDLRFQNNFPFAVSVKITLTENTLTACLLAKEEITPVDIEFEYETFDNYKEVRTIQKNNGNVKQIACSRYYLLHTNND